MSAKVEHYIENILTSLFMMIVKFTDWCWLVIA